MTNDYICREDAVEETLKYIISSGVSNQSTWNECIRTIADTLQDMRPADVAPVVHGHWEYIDDTYCGFKDTDVRCSVCKITTNIKRFRKTKWCPDCGAKMDGEE